MMVTLKELLLEAEHENKAVGSFTVPNMEIMMGTIRAAEEMKTPVIIQIAEGRMGHTPSNYIGPMMVQAAKDAAVRVCVHLDHGLSVKKTKEVLAYGFTSVMFDGSRFSLDENIRRTSEIAYIARAAGASVEAELGTIGGKEATDRNEKVSYTDTAEVIEFVNCCDIDALAVAIGNAHGHYHGIPRLNFERLEEIHKAVNMPLVLHGGSGISDSDFRRCIEHGVRKINIATASLDAMTEATEYYFRKEPELPNFYDLSEAMREGVYRTVRHLIKVFNNKEEL